MPGPATNPFTQVANSTAGFGDITITVTAHDVLYVFDFEPGGVPASISDTQSNVFNPVQSATGGACSDCEGLFNTTVKSSGSDTISLHGGGDTGIALETANATATLASGDGSGGSPAYPSSLPKGSIGILGAAKVGSLHCPSDAGSSWNVSCDQSFPYSQAASVWSQNVSSGASPEFMMNGTVSGVFLWAEIGLQSHVPPAPTGLVISGIGYHRATATWTNPSGTVLNDTAYLCNTTATCPATLWANSTSGPATTFTWIGLAIDHTYGVAISAWNSTGQSAKVWTNFTTLSYPTPAAPTALTVEPYSSNPTTDLELTWTNPSTGGLVDDNTSAWLGATSCAGMPSTESRGPATHVSELSIWYGLTPQTPYSFEVAVNNSTGWSQHTACVTNWTTPLAPTGLMNTTLSFTSIDLSWTNPGSGVGLVNDTVYWEVGSSCSGTNSANSTTGAASSYFLMDLPAGTTLAISVTAWDQGGQSAQSNCLVLMTYSYPPPPTASSMDIFPLICLAIIAAIIVYAVNKRKKQGQWWG
jgi:hypothetical protein